MKARQTVATAAIVSATVIVLAELGRPESEGGGGLPQPGQLVGFAVVFTMLSILADFNLEFAGGLSLVAMFAILFGPQPGAGKQAKSPIEYALDFLGQRGGFSS